MTVTLSYGKDTTTICRIKGAICKATYRFDMQDLVAVPNAQSDIVLYGANRTTPLAKVKVTPNGVIAFDLDGDLIVPTCTQPACTGGGNAKVVKIAPPYTGAAPAIARDDSDVVVMTLDRLGNLYTWSYNSALVNVYAPPYTAAPSAQIGNGIDDPLDMTVDASGNLFVANVSKVVSEYTAPVTSSSAPAVMFPTTGYSPTAVAVSESGTLFVATPGANAVVTVYIPPSTTPVGTIMQGLLGPTSMCTDSNGDVFVSNIGGVDVTEYTAFNNPAPAATIPLHGVGGKVVIDATNTIFAVSPTANTVTESAPPYSSTTNFSAGLTAASYVAISP